MADLRIYSSMKVKTLKANFKKTYGATLRVYTTPNCKTFANDEATLGSLMGSKKGGEATFGGNLHVGHFEKKITEMYGIGVQVAIANNTALADNTITLAAAGKRGSFRSGSTKGYPNQNKGREKSKHGWVWIMLVVIVIIGVVLWYYCISDIAM